MHIESIEIKNFRGFKHEKVCLDNYNCFVGPNGAGKSTVLNALNVFFRQSNASKTDLATLVEDDFHHKDVSEPIEITVEFGGLSEEAKSDLADYVRQDKLIVTAKAEFGFTNIEFNPKKSINCQAYSASVYASLMATGSLQRAIESPESFQEVMASEYQAAEGRVAVQSVLI